MTDQEFFDEMVAVCRAQADALRRYSDLCAIGAKMYDCERFSYILTTATRAVLDEVFPARH